MFHKTGLLMALPVFRNGYTRVFKKSPAAPTPVPRRRSTMSKPFVILPLAITLLAAAGSNRRETADKRLIVPSTRGA